MWDLQMSHPFGRLSMRSILLFVTSLVVTIFAYILVTTPSAYAADATWKGKSLVYDGHQYISTGPASANDGTDLKPETQVFQYVEAPGATTSSAPSPQKDHVIYFDPGVDPTTATSATYAEYDFTPPKTYEHKTNIKTISLDKQNDTNQGATSCDSTFTFGIGWVICPVTNFLSGAMDWLFQILTGFLTVRPAQTGQENALYRAWSYMRNFANIAFVIGFLFLIYSQLTSLGLSNYGIKKMLPRLIIAAILVNISYWICAIAIDISNILGYSVQDIFISMRNSIIGGSGNSWDVVSWKSIGGFILSGGTAAVAAGIGIHALIAGTVGSAVFLLLPILAGALLSVLVALLVMAARQAIITILVIIAPLAFVAYILPNTEKYFGKWRETFITMLLVFPMFSVVFGGAQLAGIAIIQNADSINLILLGMAVQVAPVAITPLLIRFGGGLLSRFAGIVNNPGKGMVDRTRKWSQERADQHKDRILGSSNARGLNRLAQGIDARRRNRTDRQSANKTLSDARWARDQRYSDIQQSVFEGTQVKETGEALAQKRYEDAKSNNAWVQSIDMHNRATKQSLDISKQETEGRWEDIKAGHVDPNRVITAHDLAHNGLARQIFDNTERAQVLTSSLHAAQHVQQHNFATELEASEALRTMAGGIDPKGASKAEATAVSALTRSKAEAVENIKKASPVVPGDAPRLRQMFETAIADNDIEMARAYADLLADAANPGFEQLRASIAASEGNMSEQLKTELKIHINSSGSINAGAEDIASWSRDKANGDRPLNVISNEKATWAGLSASAFAGMKKSSQLQALRVGGISKQIAGTVLDGPAVQNLKDDVLDELYKAAGRQKP